MSHSNPPSKANVGELIDFKWGNKRGVGVKNKDIQHYESFVYEGVEYFLYDCVYLFPSGQVETSIGKLVQIFETPNHEKMIKVVWFLRPAEIRNYLGQYHPRWNELFLASGDGEGKGVSNVNYLESIIGKCSVICTSKDKRNPSPSEIESKKADYFFNCTFDVVRRVIIDQFTNEIDGVRVEQFFNRNGDEKTSNHLRVGTNIRPKFMIKTKTNPCTISHCQVNDKAEVKTSENVLPKQSSDSYSYKKRKIVEEKPTIGQSGKTTKEVEIDKVELRQVKKIMIKTRDNPWTISHGEVNDKAEVKTSENVLPKQSSDSYSYKKRKIVEEKPTIGQSSKTPKEVEIDEKKVELRQDKKIMIKTRDNPWTISLGEVNDKAEVKISEDVLPKQSSDSYSYKKMKIVEEKPTIGQSSKTPNEVEIDEKKVELRQDKSVKTIKKVIDVIERPDAEKRRWFKKMPWDERLQKAQEMDTLVLLNNLDPSYTSFEVEDLVWCALKERVEARMIEWSPSSNTYYGRALVIFKTKDAAEFAIRQLNKRCLVLGEGRIVSAIKGTLCEKKKFIGHLVLDRAAHQKQHQEMRSAVSTSHCSQPNTIEYGMATEWLLHYEKSNACWNALYQKQMKEIQDVKSKLKMDRIFSDESVSNHTS